MTHKVKHVITTSIQLFQLCQIFLVSRLNVKVVNMTSSSVFLQPAKYRVYLVNQGKTMLFIYYFDGTLFNSRGAKMSKLLRVTWPETFFHLWTGKTALSVFCRLCSVRSRVAQPSMRGSWDDEKRAVLKVLPLNFTYNSYTWPVLCVSFYKVFLYEQRGSGL